MKAMFNDIYRFINNSTAILEVGVKILENNELVLGFSIIRANNNILVIYGLEKYLKDFRDIKGQHFEDFIQTNLSQLEKVITKMIKYIKKYEDASIETNVDNGLILSEYLVFRI